MQAREDTCFALLLLSFFCRPYVTVIIYNPDHDFLDWSLHPTLSSIGLVYRRSGSSAWQTAFDTTGAPLTFPTTPDPVSVRACFTFCYIILQGAIDYGFSQATWDTTYLTDDVYEIMTVVHCQASGLSFPPPGIDTYESQTISGVVHRVADHVVAISAQPQNGVYLHGDEISVTFNLPVNCDTPHWFKVALLLNESTIVTPEQYAAYCQDDTIFVDLASDKVKEIHDL